MKTPYSIIKSRHVTEKASVLQSLKDLSSNKAVRKFTLPKYVFVVDKKANKTEIAQAIEQIYAHKNIKVTSVNTINVKSKIRTVRGRMGKTGAFKKAIVTLSEGNAIDDVL